MAFPLIDIVDTGPLALFGLPDEPISVGAPVLELGPGAFSSASRAWRRFFDLSLPPFARKFRDKCGPQIVRLPLAGSLRLVFYVRAHSPRLQF